MAHVTHILVASGSASIPRLDIEIYALTDNGAEQEAKAIAKAISPQYFNFHLYSTEGEHKLIQMYKAETTTTVYNVNHRR